MNIRNKLFVPCRPFQHSLMFVSKAITYPSGAPFQVLSSRVGSRPSPTNIRQDWKGFPGTKQCRLLQMFVNYGCKKFYNIGSWRQNLAVLASIHCLLDSAQIRPSNKDVNHLKTPKKSLTIQSRPLFHDARENILRVNVLIIYKIK